MFYVAVSKQLHVPSTWCDHCRTSHQNDAISVSTGNYKSNAATAT